MGKTALFLPKSLRTGRRGEGEGQARPSPHTPHSSSLVAGKLGKKTTFLGLFINDLDEGIEGTLAARHKNCFTYLYIIQK